MRLRPADGQLLPPELSPLASYSQCSIIRDPKKYWPIRGRASLENLSACRLSTSLFYSVMTFPRAAAQRGEGRAEGSRGSRRESLHQQKGSGFPGSAAALSNDTADQCRSGAHIMAFARRLKPPFGINNFSPRSSEVTLRPWPPEKVPHVGMSCWLSVFRRCTTFRET